MTLAPLLQRIGWTYPEMARRAGLTRNQVAPWRYGNRNGNPVAVPAHVVAWLERVAAVVEKEGGP